MEPTDGTAVAPQRAESENERTQLAAGGKTASVAPGKSVDDALPGGVLLSGVGKKFSGVVLVVLSIGVMIGWWLPGNDEKHLEREREITERILEAGAGNGAVVEERFLVKCCNFGNPQLSIKLISSKS